MCLKKIEEKLNTNQYKSGNECIKDILLIFANCYHFNAVSLCLSFLKKFKSNIKSYLFKINFLLNLFFDM